MNSMHFNGHFLESPMMPLAEAKTPLSRWNHKVAVWNNFVDSGLTEITEDDCAIFPRILPASYLPELVRTARLITTFAMRLLSLPNDEICTILPAGPIRNFLINDLEVLRRPRRRLVGSFRFDMAIVGEPRPGNPPHLLEINEIGFDGLARSSFIQQALLELIPGLRKKVIVLDTAAAEIRNMRRLGSRMARFQYDSYNWDEEFLLRRGKKMGIEFRLVSPDAYKVPKDADQPLLHWEKVTFGHGMFRVGKDFYPHAYQLSFALSLEDYRLFKNFYRRLMRSGTPQYGPFVTGLVASKAILVLLHDRTLRRRLLGNDRSLEKAILPARLLCDSREKVWESPQDFVLKHADGFGGEMVFMGKELERRLRRITRSKAHEWIVQKRTPLNLLEVEGILSRPRKVISDIGVFVHYDWSRDRFQHFAVGGFISRATNRSYKVNVSGGGIQVPVMFRRGK
ncbi:MAG: hypothetical protein C5B49_14210 [Bdellovibrio sp.]|nr:MAG: hypothetical protein C5B49_14210 [Bdellovibrio sp.]